MTFKIFVGQVCFSSIFKHLPLIITLALKSDYYIFLLCKLGVMNVSIFVSETFHEIIFIYCKLGSRECEAKWSGACLRLQSEMSGWGQVWIGNCLGLSSSPTSCSHLNEDKLASQYKCHHVASGHPYLLILIKYARWNWKFLGVGSKKNSEQVNMG